MIWSGYDLYGLDGEVVVRTPFGEVGVEASDYGLLYVLLEPLIEMYGNINVDNAVVVDVGAFLGETALLFVKRGAKRVYAFEPVKTFYDYLVKNIARNSAEDKIIPFNCGVWFRNTVLNVTLLGTGTGLRVNANHPSVELDVRDLKDVLTMIHDKEGVIDLVKMDCEGCEYSLLQLDEEYIKLSKQYIMEIHGCETSLIDKMLQAGYNSKLILKLNEWVKIYLFNRPVS
jgi:FkbM family methyltransferase